MTYDVFPRLGGYEVRLVQEGFACFLGDCPHLLLDRATFDVVDPDYDGPLRLSGGNVHDDLPGTGNPLFPPLRPPGSCGDRPGR